MLEYFCPQRSISWSELKGFNTLQDIVLNSLLPSSLKVLSFIKHISIFGMKSLRRCLYNFKCKFSEIKLSHRKR